MSNRLLIMNIILALILLVIAILIGTCLTTSAQENRYISNCPYGDSVTPEVCEKLTHDKEKTTPPVVSSENGTSFAETIISNEVVGVGK